VRQAAGIRRAGLIVEVEAYAGPEDRASHARFGPSSRAASMFAAAGRAYVYGVYGMHTCLNVVVGSPGDPAAVLLRACTPVSGAEAMRAARLGRAIETRSADRSDPAAAAARLARLPASRLAVGPGNLAAAFGVTRADDGTDLLDPAGSLRLEPRRADAPPLAITAHPRVGVAYAGPGWADRLWRFAIDPAGAADRAG
jgi:DNA-3-methyladenine glycosylase